MTIEVSPARRSALIGLLVAMLASCGGGAGGELASVTGGGGISGSGKSVGSITGFGSVIVNGREFDTSGAAIVVEGASATQADLSVGQVVSVTANFDDDKASRVEYRAQIKGPVQAITVIDPALGKASLVVLGQTVETNAATNFVGTSIDPAARNPLVVGEWVEVSGPRDELGTLVASFLEEKTSLDDYKVVGPVSNVTATTFRIGALTVNYSATSANPQAGQIVEVEGAASDFDAGSSVLEAASVEVLGGTTLTIDQEAEIEGYVTRFVSAADFDVNGVRATTTAATVYEGGSAASIALGVKVEVEGQANASGVLVADKVHIESTGAVRIEGDVTAVDSVGQRLTALGVTFAVRPETELEDETPAEVEPLTVDDIGPGDRIEMRGFLDGTTVVASELDRKETQSEARLRGRVVAKNAGLLQLSILGVLITADGQTEYDGAGSSGEFFDTVQVGDFVTADWKEFSATSAPPDKLSLESED